MADHHSDGAPMFARGRHSSATSPAMELRGQCPSHTVAARPSVRGGYSRTRCIEAKARIYPSFISASWMQAASSSNCLRLASSTVLAMCLTIWLSAERIANSAPIASVSTVTSHLFCVDYVGIFSIAQGWVGVRTSTPQECTHG